MSPEDLEEEDDFDDDPYDYGGKMLYFDTPEQAHEDMRKSLIKFQKDYTAWCPVTFGVVGYNPSTKMNYCNATYQGGCHGDYINYDTACVHGTSFYSSVVTKRTLDTEYFEMALNKDTSPWRSILGHVSKVYDDASNFVGIRIDNPAEFSNQLIINFAIMFRNALEKPRVIDTWDFYRQAGIGEIEALWLAANAIIKDANATDFVAAPTNHFSFWPDYVDYTRLKTGTPNVGGDKFLFKNGSVYTPMNIIWENVSWNDRQQIRAKNNFCKTLSGKSIYKGPFVSYFKNERLIKEVYPGVYGEENLCKPKEALKIIKDNYEELFSLKQGV